ncbi:putative secreted protein [Nitrospira japonica]|uniref:Putative secreted protein n=2 Tax=Nitrospira japonica TaxID=1325564 RepID=A0A1W1IAB9_9BACT|nr:putative secreted protein [Nitrospira japonica]
MPFVRYQRCLAAVSFIATGIALLLAFPPDGSGTEPSFRHEPAMHLVAGKQPPSVDEPPVAEGIVDRYLVHPRGIVDGLLLRDGAQMHVTPRAAEGLIQIIQPGDHVRVHGRRGANSPLVTPDVIVNVTDGKSFTIPYRLDLPIPPAEARPTANEMRAAGTIEVLLYDYIKGGVNGMLLSDETQVRLPPDVGRDFPASLRPNMDVEVEGHGTTTRYGRALEATAIGRKGHPLTPLDASIQQLR